MTIICAWCKKEIDECCPTCGVPAYRIDFQRALFLRNWRLAVLLLGMRLVYGPILRAAGAHVCPSINCLQIFFMEGLGGVSHGSCRECLAKTRNEYSAAAKRAAAMEVN